MYKTNSQKKWMLLMTLLMVGGTGVSDVSALEVLEGPVSIGEGENRIYEDDVSVTTHSDMGYFVNGISMEQLGGGAAKETHVTFKKSLTMVGTSDDPQSPDYWGVTGGGYNGDYSGYKGTRWAPSAAHFSRQGGSTFSVEGDVNIRSQGHGFLADAYYWVWGENPLDNVLTLQGGTVITPHDQKLGFLALGSFGGTVNMNMNMNKELTGSGKNKVTLVGHLLASHNDNPPKPGDDVDAQEQKNFNSYFFQEGVVNLGLSTSDSSWTGMVSNSGSKQIGAVNLYISDGAVWTHEAVSNPNVVQAKTLPEPSINHYGEYDGKSHVNQFVGGSDEKTRGVVIQKEDAPILINHYSGHTLFSYDHDVVTPAVIKGGGVTIMKADIDSAVTLRTDVKGIDMENGSAVEHVLDALAGKLYYTAYKEGERNLAGKVEIAEGLLTSSKSLKLGNMSFSSVSGQGQYVADAPETEDPSGEQTLTEFSTPITGIKSDDMVYVDAGVLSDEGKHYIFSKDTVITGARGVKVGDLDHEVLIQAKDRILTFEATMPESKELLHAVEVNSEKGMTVTAEKIVINAENKGRAEALNIGGQGAKNATNPFKLTVNGDVEVNAHGANYTLGLYAAGNADILINGNVTMKGKEEESKWGVWSDKGAFSYYGVSGLYSGNNYSIQKGPKLKVTGDVDLVIDGNGIFANGGHSDLEVGGGHIEVNRENKNNYYAILAESSTISINVERDGEGLATAAGARAVTMKGNAGASSGAVHPNEPDPYTYVNIGLSTGDSEWTGVAYNAFPDEGIKSGNKTAYGEIHLFVKNGATWKNEQWGGLPAAYGGGKFAGSRIAKLVGGTDEESRGIVLQKENTPITINQYVGHMLVSYAHDEKTPTTVIGGDTIIKKADADSHITLRTDNGGLKTDSGNADDVNLVNNTLNALANKLYYTAYKDGERNLTGRVEIAEGLTGSSKALELKGKKGIFSFDEKTGQGAYVYEKTQQDEYNQIITGFMDTPYAEYYKDKGILQADGKYIFKNDTKISTDFGLDIYKNQWPNVIRGFASIVIDAAGKTLTMETKGESNEEEARSAVYNLGGTEKIVDITAGKLILRTEDTTGGDVYGIYAANPVNVHGETEIDLQSAGREIGIRGGSNIHLDGLKVSVNDYSSSLAIWGTGGKTSINIDNGLAGDKVVQLKGNIKVSRGQLNLALSGSDSFWRGQGTGNINMWLQNGAIWENAADGKASSIESKISRLIAGSDEMHQGVILYGNEKSTTIGNYSGNAVILYAHSETERDEVTKGLKIIGGDTIIEKADVGSRVLLRTDAAGLKTDSDKVADKNLVNATLDSLAGKLYYTAYKNGEKNLTGGVEIAESLTSSAKELDLKADLGRFSFDEKTGQGVYIYTESQEMPSEDTEFNQTITGREDLFWQQAGIKKGDQYIFTKNNSKVNGRDNPAVHMEQSMTIQAKDKTLTLHGDNAAIVTEGKNNLKITAGNLIVNGKALIEAKGGSTVSVTGRTDMTGELLSADGVGTQITLNEGNYRIDEIRATSGGRINFYGSQEPSKISADLKGVRADGKDSKIYLYLDGGNAILNGNIEGDGQIEMGLSQGGSWTGASSAKLLNLHLDKGIWTNTGASYINFLGDTSNEGTIYMKEGSSLDVSRYVGSKMTFVYEHDPTAPTVLKGGNVTIHTAYERSQVIMRTDNVGLNTQSQDAKDKKLVSDTLNALANKLYYTGYMDNQVGVDGIIQPTGERKLKGIAEIAEGLISSSVAIAGDISFKKETGQGFYEKAIIDPIPSDDVTKTSIDGTEESEKIYGEAGIFDNGEYHFTDNPSGIATDTPISAGNKDLIVKADGTLDLTAAQAGIHATEGNSVTLTAPQTHINDGNLGLDADHGTISVHGDIGIKAGGIGMKSVGEEGHVSVDNKTVVNSEKDGVVAADRGTVTLMGETNVTAKGNAIQATNGGEVVLEAKENITNVLNGNVVADKGSVIAKGGNDINGNVTVSKEGGIISLETGTVAGSIIADDKGMVRLIGTNVIKDMTATKDGQIHLTDGILGGVNLTADGSGSLIEAKDGEGKNSLYAIKAIQADNGASVAVGGHTVTVSQGIVAGDKAKVAVVFNGQDSHLLGDVKGKGDVALTVQNGADWIGDAKETAVIRAVIGKEGIWTGKSENDKTDLTLEGRWKQNGDSQIRSLIGIGGILDKTDDKAGKTEIGTYSGNTIVLYAHDITDDAQRDNAALYGGKAIKVLGGDIIVDKAEKGAVITLRTDNKGLHTEKDAAYDEKNLVNDTLDKLANKLIYGAYENGEKNLSGNVEIAEGLTAQSVSKRLEKMSFKPGGQGEYKYELVQKPSGEDPVDPITPGDDETQLMKGGKAASVSSAMLVTTLWRNEINDIQRRMGDITLGKEETGIWAKYQGGKSEIRQDRIGIAQEYNLAQVGYDKKVGDWTIGGAFTYGTADGNFSYGYDDVYMNGAGKSDQTLASLALYGSLVKEDGQYFDLIIRGSQVKNEYTASAYKGEAGEFRMDGDYKTNGYSFSAEYGKRIKKDSGFYIEPSVEITAGRLASQDYDAKTTHVTGATMRIHQDSVNSIVGRIGLTVGQEREKSSYFAKLALAHEFDGKIRTSFRDLSSDAPAKSTEFDLGDTWIDLELGGSVKMGDNTYLYGTYTRNFGAKAENKWRVDAGIRFSF